MGTRQDMAETSFEHRSEGGGKGRISEKELSKRREQHVQGLWDENMPGT